MQHSIAWSVVEDPPADVVLAVAYSYGYNDIEHMLRDMKDDDEDEPAVVPHYPNGWTKPKLQRYMLALKPNAAKACVFIAQQVMDGEQQVPSSAVQDFVGLYGQQYAGSMASCGFAARNTRGVSSPPWTKDGTFYALPLALAELLVEVCTEQGIGE